MAPVWRWVSVAGALVVVTGLLPAADVRDLLARVAPVLVFLVGITVVAELADRVGLFDVAARAAAHAARGRTVVLFLLLALVAVAVTVLVSLDTTAVLLTPLVVVLTRRLGLPVLPFAVMVVWLANTASLLLPVSNLTNLLAVDAFDAVGAHYVVVMALPAAAVVAATVGLLLVCYSGRLRGRFEDREHVSPPDRLLVVLAGAACAGVGTAVTLGVEPAVAAGAAAVLLLVVVAVRARHLLSARLLPWRLVLLTTGLFLVVQAVADRGLAALLAGVAGTGDGPADLLRLAATAAVASNVLTNLPAYLALEPAAAGSAARLAALLVGTDAGPLVTPWGSLATLLWLDRCRAGGVRVPLRHVVLLGLVAAPVAVLAGTGGLLLAQRAGLV
ncbi:SLC13 family permease [Aquipuribacter hungaricus]|uniref:SLC13 family permease n=1 Tax=Aquipuribacter hungaricus TaxID=545624 RepID=A0ABV7WIE1_9MICO